VRSVDRPTFFVVGLPGGVREPRASDLDQRDETPEIRTIEGQQSVHAAVQHRRDDIRIVDLAAGDAMRRNQFDQPIERARSSATRNVVRNRWTSLIAVSMGSPGAVAWGRVTAARYSRNICGLIHRIEPAAPSRAKARAAAKWCAESGRVE
jgi:hypothetical protein